MLSFLMMTGLCVGISSLLCTWIVVSFEIAVAAPRFIRIASILRFARRCHVSHRDGGIYPESVCESRQKRWRFHRFDVEVPRYQYGNITQSCCFHEHLRNQLFRADRRTYVSVRKRVVPLPFPYGLARAGSCNPRKTSAKLPELDSCSSLPAFYLSSRFIGLSFKVSNPSAAHKD